MHRGRQLPPINKAREETSAILKDLRAELAVLETANRAVEEQQAQEAQSKVSKKSKSLIARRLLEQHRLLAQQRHHDEAAELAAHVVDYNIAMRDQAAAHIHRVIIQRDVVRSSAPSPTARYAENSNLELATPGVMGGGRDGRPSSAANKFRASSVSIKKELGTMKAMLHDILSSSAHAQDHTRSGDRHDHNESAIAQISTPHHDVVFKKVVNAYRPPDLDVEVLQRKAEERLRRLEEVEISRKRTAVIRAAGSLAFDDAIVDGRVIRENAEENQKSFSATTAITLPGALLDRATSSRARFATFDVKEDQREVQNMAQQEKQRTALMEQRGVLRRFRERLALLEAEDVQSTIDHTETLTHNVCAIATESKLSGDAVEPPTDDVGGVSFPVAEVTPIDAAQPIADPHSSERSSPRNTPQHLEVTHPGRHESDEATDKRDRVGELRALCAQMEDRGETERLRDAQSRLILALYREMLTAASIVVPPEAISTVLTAFLRALVSGQIASIRRQRLHDAACTIQRASRIPTARDRLAARHRIARKVRRWYTTATLAEVAAVTLQSWIRGLMTRNPRTGRPLSSQVAMYRASLVTIVREEAAVRVQSLVRAHAAAKLFTPRRDEHRAVLASERIRSDALFEQDMQSGMWQ